MATDVVFYLKEFGKGKDLPWPGPVKLIAVDPTEFFCGGADPRCSTAYTNLHAALRDASGSVMSRFLAKYARGVDVGRVAFVSFSAGHGFMNPLLANDADRARISAVLLIDSTFGGGKTGYQKALIDAAAGRMLLATTTSNTGGDEAWRSAVWEPVLQQTGMTPEHIATLPPMPEPSGGVQRLGELAYYFRFVSRDGTTELPHWKMGQITEPMLQGVLIPYWSGRLGGGGFGAKLVALGIAAVGVAIAWATLRVKPGSR
jgi:hypothetical protein